MAGACALALAVGVADRQGKRHHQPPVTASSKVKPLRAPRKRQRKPAAGPKKPRKSRVVFDFSLELLEQYFHLSQRDAAKMLAVSAITMKRNCKRLHIMWPYRSNKLKAARNVRERAPTSVTNGQQMGSSSRERIGSLSSSEDSERNKDDNDNNNNNYDDDDGDEDKYDEEDDAMSDAESAATAAVTQFTAALSLQPSLPSGAASHSDAALVFARLPFLCLAEKTLEERERATRSTRCVL
ncbi:hypothetical protein PybrP1_001782 [[Pythium] brassicae (nom. inval.)]|nr:hypothetical protein PybrP1_001782 [[Pythium] brassicae (nom. inval.)]